MSSDGDYILSIRDVTCRFGGLVAVNQLSVDIARGAIHAIIGPNGSGKTTLLNSISGALRPQQGSITFDGRELVGRRRYRIARFGLSRTFQNIRLFNSMTALQNVMVTRGHHSSATLLDVVIRGRRFTSDEAAMVRKSEEALALVGLSSRRDDLVGALPYAQQRLVEIARAIAGDPKLLLLDEPAAGMNMTEATELLDRISALRHQGITILLVEHNMRLVMGVSDRITAIEFGRKIAEGPPREIQNHPDVIAAYLGKPRHAA